MGMEMGFGCWVDGGVLWGQAVGEGGEGEGDGCGPCGGKAVVR